MYQVVNSDGVVLSSYFEYEDARKEAVRLLRQEGVESKVAKNGSVIAVFGGV